VFTQLRISALRIQRTHDPPCLVPAILLRKLLDLISEELYTGVDCCQDTLKTYPRDVRGGILQVCMTSSFQHRFHRRKSRPKEEACEEDTYCDSLWRGESKEFVLRNKHLFPIPKIHGYGACVCATSNPLLYVTKYQINNEDLL